jgi:hypothetical protein
LLTFTEQFDNAAWTKGNSTITANAGVAPDGTTTADKLIPNTASNSKFVNGSPFITASISQPVTHSCYVKADGYSKIALRESASTGAYASFDLSAVTVIETGNAGSIVVSNAAITSVGSGWYRIRMTCTNTVGTQLNGLGAWPLPTSYTTGQPQGTNWAGDGTSGVLLWGAQLETGSTATAYQRVVSQYDVTEAGVSSLSYLQFDTSKFLVTPTITPGIDKAQVFAGVRKLSDAAAGTLVESSGNSFSNNGAFAIAAPGSIGVETDSYITLLRGTSATGSRQNTFAAPVTNVLSVLFDIAQPAAATEIVFRANGVVDASDGVGSLSANAGTGNFLAYPLFIGIRGNAGPPYTSPTIPLNGQIFSLIVRFGANLTADQITSTETWVNGKTRAY